MTAGLDQQEISEEANTLRWMYGKIFYVVLLFFLFFYLENNVNAQLQVTGHVFAEIVEPTALSAKTSNDHFISSQNRTSERDMILAEVKLSGKDVNIGVSVQSGPLQSAAGETMLFTAYACARRVAGDPASLHDESLFTLKGTPGETARLKNKSTFNGRYRVTFMYD